MPTALEIALDFARRGWYVFPIQPGTKFPYRGFRWKEKSTCNQRTIQEAAAHSRYKECNWALDVSRSGLLVLDSDSYKKQFKGLPGDPGETLQVTTPRGGDQYYYKDAEGIGRNTAETIAPAVDTRGSGGYVLIPGSANGNGKPYLLKKDLPPADPPDWLVDAMGKPVEKDPLSEEPLVEWDLPHNIEAYKRYLLHDAPEAIEGFGGDDITYKIVAMRGVDLALSREKTLELMLEHWNETKAIPRWSPPDLAKKVENAYQYHKDRPGNAAKPSVEEMFEVAPPMTEEEKLAEKRHRQPMWLPDDEEGEDEFYTCFHELRAKPLEVNWVVPGYIEEDTVNVWFGDWGHLKSFLVGHLGLLKAAGMMWVDQELSPGAVLNIQGEGQGGTKRRVEAFCKKYNIPEDAHVPFFTSKGPAPINDKGTVEYVVKKAEKIKKKYGRVELIIIDTLTANFGMGNENQTEDMKQFINQCNEIRRRLKCAILIIHHTGLGDKGRTRGSTVLSAGADSVFKVSRDDMHVCLHRPVKMKDGEPPADTWFSAEVIQLGMDKDLKPITSLALEYISDYQPAGRPKRLGVNQQFLIDNIPQEGISKDDLQEIYRDFKGESYDRNNFYRTLRGLTDSNLCFERDDLVFGVF